MGVQKSKKSQSLIKKKRSFLKINKKLLINKKLFNKNLLNKINLLKSIFKSK